MFILNGQLINRLGDIFSVVNSLYTVLGFVLAIFTKVIFQYIKNYKLQKVLSFKKKSKCKISTNIITTDSIQGLHEVMSTKEVICQYQLILLLSRINISAIPSLIDDTNNDSEICIGYSAKTMFFVNSYIENFEWHADKCCFIYGKGRDDILEFDDKGEYIILIKLNNTILKNNKTVHLLFGASENSSVQAVRFFIENHTYIYEKFKGKPYFIALRISHNNRNIRLDSMKNLSRYILGTDIQI